ncbi:MAG: hypothetical protein QOH60_4564 [Mycobacterium sp.]|jgi:pimeloyl-ACP methyl ester carboxylesterase|nr:hypothetical protein [Mycobacterium sp.]
MDSSVDVDGHQVGVWRFGSPGGWPLVWNHGGLSCGMDATVMDEAGRHCGAEIIAIDRPGIGHSDLWNLASVASGDTPVICSPLSWPTRYSTISRRNRPSVDNGPMAKYSLNEAAVAKARELIDARQYVLDSDWGEVQPRADAQNAYLESHSWDEYAAWHLGLTEGAADETKARYAFVYGDLRRLHRSGLIACVYRAAEWRHKDVEVAAHELLQHLDKKTGLEPTR